MGSLKNAGLHNPIHKLYLGEPGLLPSVEFGYRFRWIDSIRYGISGTKKGRRKMRPFYMTAKINLYVLKDENELLKNIVLSSNTLMNYRRFHLNRYYIFIVALLYIHHNISI